MYQKKKKDFFFPFISCLKKIWFNRNGWLILNYFTFFRYCSVPWIKLNQVILSHENFVIFTEKSQYHKLSLILSGCEWGLSSVKSSESPRWLEALTTFLDQGAGSGRVSWLWACESPVYLGKYPLPWLAWAAPNGIQAGYREWHRMGDTAAPSPWGGLGCLYEKQLARHRPGSWCN